MSRVVLWWPEVITCSFRWVELASKKFGAWLLLAYSTETLTAIWDPKTSSKKTFFRIFGILTSNWIRKCLGSIEKLKSCKMRHPTDHKCISVSQKICTPAKIPIELFFYWNFDLIYWLANLFKRVWFVDQEVLKHSIF